VGGNQALIQFNASALPAGTTSAGIAKATLRLWVNKVNTPGSIDVFATQSAWSESTATFNSAPAVGSLVARRVRSCWLTLLYR